MPKADGYWRYAGVVLLVLCSTRAARAVVVETLAGRRVTGVLVSKDEKTVKITREAEDGSKVEEEFTRANLRRVIVSLDPARLAKLDPARPGEYRDYAEELAPKTADPEARETALRLFLLAAKLDPKLAKSALLGASALAGNAAEGREYIAMAYMLDPSAGPGSLVDPTLGDETVQDEASWNRFRRALQQYRRGRLLPARTLARPLAVQQYFQLAPALGGYEQFVQVCMDNKPCTLCVNGVRISSQGRERCACQSRAPFIVPPDQLEAILRLERQSEPPQQAPTGPRPVVRGGAGAGSGDWNSLLERQALGPMPVLTLEALSPFDLRESVYRQGRWVEPGK